MPTGPHGGGFNVLGAVYLALVLALIFVPMLVHRGSPPDDDDDGRDDGGGGGRPEPPPPPSGPSGRIPLPDAEPSRVRLRGPGRLADARGWSPRRSAPHRPPRHTPRV